MAENFPIELHLKALDDKLTSTLEKVSKAFEKLEENSKKTKEAMSGFQKAAAIGSFVGTTAANVLGKGISFAGQVVEKVAEHAKEAVIKFVDFQSHLNEFGRTAQIQGKGLEHLGEKFIKLSHRIPVTADALLDIGTNAAKILDPEQRTEKNIFNLTETFARLSKVSDIKEPEGLLKIGQFVEGIQDGYKTIPNVANALLELAHHSKASAGNILDFANELKGIKRFGGITQENLLGLAAGFSDIGIEAGSGGTAITRAFIEIEDAIQKGGNKFELLQGVTKQTGKDLKENFKKDSVGVFKTFIEGLRDVKEEKLTAFLDEFNLGGMRLEKIIPAMVNHGDKLTQQIKRSNLAFKEQKTLVNDTKFDSLGAKLQMAKNRLAGHEIELGMKLGPNALKVVDIFNTLFDTFTKGGGVEKAAGGALEVIGNLLEKFQKGLGAKNTQESIATFIKLLTDFGKIAGDVFGKALEATKKLVDQITDFTTGDKRKIFEGMFNMITGAELGNETSVPMTDKQKELDKTLDRLNDAKKRLEQFQKQPTLFGPQIETEKQLINRYQKTIDDLSSGKSAQNSSQEIILRFEGDVPGNITAYKGKSNGDNISLMLQRGAQGMAIV
jgi:TP901 family phage tail tape measure protein